MLRVRPKKSLTKPGMAEDTAKETMEKPGKRSEMMPNTAMDFYSGMRPEYREELMKHNQDGAAARDALLANFEKLAESNRKKKLLESNTKKKLSESKRSGISTGQYSAQDDLDHDRCKSDAKKMACEAESFALYLSGWESKWRKTRGLFSNITVLSSMQFTHCTPGYSPSSSSCSTPEILQIYSVKLVRHAGGPDIPLSVYGEVAVRDTVDRNRNLLFSRDISEAQKLTENDPFLHLIGPYRAIVNTDEVWIEVELKVPGASPKDNALFSLAHRYTGETNTGSSTSTIILDNVFCTLELCLQQVEQTVQATILGVQVVKDDWSWPFEYGGLVACSPLSEETQSPDSGSSNNLQIVLIDSKGEAMPKGSGGYIHLQRQVVSVKRQGVLNFVIKAYSQSGAIAEETCARFLPKDCNISQEKCVLGDARVTITVAWSHVATSKMGDALENCGKSATPLAKKTAAEDMTYEAQEFASYRTRWESKWRETCGLFTDKTVLSSMLFTHYTPGRRPCSHSCTTLKTMQIFSIKLTPIHEDLGFPLFVYGVVAVRDIVDHNRNLLFSCHISEAQELKQNDPFLHLSGPSRAIVFTDTVSIEIELKVKDVAGPQDKTLMICARHYMVGHIPDMSTICFKNVFCTLEMCLEPVVSTVQATILGVQVVKDDGSWPLEYGGVVACSAPSGEIVITDNELFREIDQSTSPVVLIDSKDAATLKGDNGYVRLWRQVVSVNLQGLLDVIVKAYSESGAVAAETCASFMPKVCNISQRKCRLEDAEVTITVAWSRVATSKMDVAQEYGRKCA